MQGDAHKPPTTTTSSLEASQQIVQLRQVRVVHAPVLPKRSVAILESAPLIVGRESDEEVGMAIADREISRRHVAFELEGDTWYLRDLESRNGMFVNGTRATRVALHDNAVIRIGKSLLLYQEVELKPAEPLKPETPELRGPSLAMQRVRADIALVASKNVPVLILGETGVGKELVAEEIHRQSGRKGALVPVNCAALPAELAESELFGHAAGAFTGAAKRTDGLFIAAQGGTLFLDEIGEMPTLVQPKVLRALAKGEVRPVGAHETTRVDVRVIAATHRDLGNAARAGEGFRGDLLARLSGWTIRVAPLRERRDDILPLAGVFLGKEGHSKLSTEAAEALMLYDFPFNVRELEQVLGAAAVRASASGGIVRAEHLPDEIAVKVRGRAAAGVPVTGDPPIEALVPRDVAPTKADFCKVLEQFGGNVAQVAEFFRKDRQQIYRWAKRFDIDLDTYRA
jgi:transcriptional regulator with GAF, ATPase, and Fis domain